MIATSTVSSGSSHPLLSRTSVTSAPFFSRRVSEPEKIISSAFCPRIWRTFCSPSTQRTASEILLFPHPFGPTMTVMPSEKSIVVLSAKDLKPCSVNRSSFMSSPSLHNIVLINRHTVFTVYSRDNTTIGLLPLLTKI